MNYLFPDYNAFKRTFDEPTRAIDEYLRGKIYISEELRDFLTRSFETLKAFNAANFTKHYGSLDGWHVLTPKVEPEEELKDRAMTFLLFDKDAYGWKEPSRF